MARAAAAAKAAADAAAAKAVNTLLERLKRVIAFWFKYRAHAHSWVSNLRNNSFKSVMVDFLDKATNKVDRPKRLSGILSLVNKVVHEVHATASEKADVAAVLKQWPCFKDCRSKLGEDGFRKRCNGTSCTDRNCGFAHPETIIDGNNTPVRLKFGLKVDGVRRLYHAGLQDIMRDVPPASYVSTADLFKTYDDLDELDSYGRTPEQAQRDMCRLARTETHPALQVASSKPTALPFRPAMQEEPFSLGAVVDVKKLIKETYHEDAVHKRTVDGVVNHSQVAVLKADASRENKTPLDDDAFRDWVEDHDEEWFTETLFTLDGLQRKADDKASKEERSRAIRKQRYDEGIRLRQKAADARASRS